MPLPNSLEAFGLHNCDGTPCLPGIELGITQRSNIETRFSTLQSFQTDTKRSYFQQVGLATYNEIYFNADGWVNYVMVARNESSPAGQIGMIFAEYGYPCEVYLEDLDIGYFMDLIYPHFELGIRPDYLNNGFDRYSPVVSVSISERVNCTDGTTILTYPDVGRWRGFVWNYYESQFTKEIVEP